MTATDEELRNLFTQLIDHDRREGINPTVTADGVLAFAKLGRERVLAITAERDRLAAEVRGLEETAAERQQNAVHWQERAEAADVLLDQARDEIERLSTDLAAYDYYDGPPPRAIDSTPDISDYQET